MCVLYGVMFFKYGLAIVAMTRIYSRAKIVVFWRQEFGLRLQNKKGANYARHR
jgi:hypothetical protein